MRKIKTALLLLALGAAAHAQQPAGRPLLVTIDDLPISATRLHSDPAERERITRGMLDVLRKHKVPAVAFVTWDHVLSPADRGLLRLWMDAGHELGNHTLHHLNYTRTSPKEYIADAETARQEIAKLAGGKVR